jgi:probable HAF family extracellular repeat protein
MTYGKFSCVLAAALLATASIPASIAQDAPTHRTQTHYFVISLGTPLGGSSSGAAAVNDLGWIAGDSNLTGDQVQNAVLWLYGYPLNLHTLGGPNSSALWPGLNNFGQVIGISDTAATDPYGESWSCGAFLPASHAGHTCVAFLWQLGVMTALPTLGGNNGFGTGINNRGQAVGWAENTVHDPTCNPPQTLQFEAVVWGPRGQVQILPPYSTDPDGAATGINDRGQVIGISGICQNAVGNRSAIHALLWQNGHPTDLGNLGGLAWNTPMALNNRGQIVGFSDMQGDDNGANPNFHAFLWTSPGPMQDLHTLTGDAISEALGINEAGQVVGVSYAAGFANPRAFIYQNGRITDLNSVVQQDSPLYLQAAQEINNSGVIVGQGCVPGNCSSSSPTIAFVAIPRQDQHDSTAPVSSGTDGQVNVASQELLQRLGLAGAAGLNIQSK